MPPEHRTTLRVALFGAVLGALLSWVTSRGLIDDTYITLSYARNLAEHGHWGMTPGLMSNAATSPLNVALLAGCLLLVQPFAGMDGELALGVLTTLLGALAGWWSARAAARLGLSAAWPAAALVVVLANPFLVSALGLEVVLLFTAMTGLLAAGLAGRPVLYGLVAAAGLLARLDMVVFVVVLALACTGILRRLPVAVLACVVACLPWFAFSWWWLGSAIPDTFVIKTNQRNFGEGRTYLRGLWTHYAPNTPLTVAVSVVAAALGLLVLALLVLNLLRRRARPGTGGLLGLGVGGVGYFAVYSVLGVPPYQWYYVPPMAALSFVAVLGTGVLLGRRAVRRPGAVVAGALAVAALAGLVVSVPATARSLPWPYPPVFANFATPAEYRLIGAEVGRVVGDRRVASPGEIGTLAYSCDCEIIDQFSDPSYLQGVIDARTAESGPLLRRLLEFNYTHRDPPPAQPTPFVLRWTDAGADPALGIDSWPTTQGTWQRRSVLVLLPG
ncbi:hypothetical protein FHR75_000527 [Kineococcus radiotolerans]|uniref:Glycosyltransferase RgtA/B/C/D-like domain-containing protein n=1 Tax=Kineococcus radiotolerans TaxID=131568 RepID=A0A7W4TIU9_KINRA|nr:hypothetical protein [Kineococcus radiotolerans]MBB2899739.1 hypothetical protein [Kineococcus radiotolerans]